MRELLEKVYAGKYKSSSQTRNTINLFAPSAIAVDAENVSQWVEETNPQVHELLPIMPHRLPFPVMWFEWTALNVHEGGLETSGTIGALAFELYDYKGTKERGEDEVTCMGIMVMFFLHDQNMALTVITGNATFNENFTDCHYGWQYQTPEVFVDEPKEIAEIYCLTGMPVVCACLCFFVCRNVEVRVIQPSKKKEKANNRKGISTPEYHVIEVHKKTVRNVYGGGISASSAVRHASLVRGHFKTYKEDNKLFGNQVGTWFWSSHVRGDIGTPTAHDYKVYEPRHKGKCF